VETLRGPTHRLRFVIHEGRKRQIREMCAAVGLDVGRLIRVRIGPLRLGDLAPGAFRPLRPAEVAALRRAILSAPETSKPAARGGKPGREDVQAPAGRTAHRAPGQRPAARGPGRPGGGESPSLPGARPGQQTDHPKNARPPAGGPGRDKVPIRSGVQKAGSRPGHRPKTRRPHGIAPLQRPRDRSASGGPAPGEGQGPYPGKRGRPSPVTGKEGEPIRPDERRNAPAGRRESGRPPPGKTSRQPNGDGPGRSKRAKPSEKARPSASDQQKGSRPAAFPPEGPARDRRVPSGARPPEPAGPVGRGAGDKQRSSRPSGRFPTPRSGGPSGAGGRAPGGTPTSGRGGDRAGQRPPDRNKVRPTGNSAPSGPRAGGAAPTRGGMAARPSATTPPSDELPKKAKPPANPRATQGGPPQGGADSRGGGRKLPPRGPQREGFTRARDDTASPGKRPEAGTGNLAAEGANDRQPPRTTPPPEKPRGPRKKPKGAR
jgi:23S rRNA pseudouridine2605 synthase